MVWDANQVARMIMTGEFGFERALFPVQGVPAPVDPQLVFAALEDAGVTLAYPGFDDWFSGKVASGLRSGERLILTSMVDGVLAGVAICKRTEAERKLSTLWVAPGARRQSIAATLASEAFAWLGTDRPLFTVPEERLPDFRGLLRCWSFSEPVAYCDLYRPDKVEYVFNGRMARMSH